MKRSIFCLVLSFLLVSMVAAEPVPAARFGARAMDHAGPGVMVTEVQPQSPAATCGLQPRDLILAINGRALQNEADYSRAIDAVDGAMVLTVISREDGSYHEVQANLSGGPRAKSRPPFGAAVRDNNGGGVIVTSVAPSSAAARAELEPRDVIVSIDGQPLRSQQEFSRLMEAAGASISIQVRNWRDGGNHGLVVRFQPPLVQQRFTPPPQISRVIFGARVQANTGGQLVVTQVISGSPADQSGLEPKDVLLAIDGNPLTSEADFARAVDRAARTMRVQVRNWRDGKVVVVTAQLNAIRGEDVASTGNSAQDAIDNSVWIAPSQLILPADAEVLGKQGNPEGQPDPAWLTSKSGPRFKSAPPAWKSHYPNVKSVCGSDQRAQIIASTRFPYSAICNLLITGKDGTTGLGTGWFVGPACVITAGHCVHQGGPDGDWVKQIEVVPSMSGSWRPHGSIVSTRFLSLRGWTRRGKSDYDVGAVLLPTTRMADRVGWFGFSYLPAAGLQSKLLQTAGYPGDKSFGTMWYMSGHIDAISERKVSYLIDTYGGQSGSPLFYTRNGLPYAVGVHTNGGCPNKATRISRGLFNTIKQWRAYRPQ